MKKLLSAALTILLISCFGITEVFADEEDPFTPFVDIDPDNLVDISSNYSLSDFRYHIVRETVIDSAVNSDTQLKYDILGNHSISFTGSYYDNTIMGINSCSSSSYQQTYQHTDGVENVTISPYIVGDISIMGFSLNYGIEVNDENLGEVTSTSNTVTNTTEACKIIGYENNDSALDGQKLLSMGYERKTATSYYNGHEYTATFYVPGSESINMESFDFQRFIENMVASVMSSLVVDYHYEYDLSIYTFEKAMPSYGRINTSLWLPYFVDSGFYDDTENSFTNYKLDWIEGNASFFYGNNSFFNHVSNGIYDQNYATFVWSGTTDPHYKFSAPEQRWISQTSDGTSMNSSPFLVDLFTSKNSTFTTSYLYTTVSDAMVAKNSVLTSGNKIGYKGADSFKAYKLQDAGRLSLFNQLGSFLNEKFNQLKSVITGIDPSGSTNVTQDIQNDYNINPQIEINNYLETFTQRDQNIDLTQPEFTLPDQNSLNLLSDIPSRTIAVFTNNRLGFMIFVPIVLGVIGLVL